MLDDATIEEFRGRLRGPLLTAEDPDYDEARAVRNGLIDRRPALIARCSGTADVVACVNFARERGLTLSVRGARTMSRVMLSMTAAWSLTSHRCVASSSIRRRGLPARRAGPPGETSIARPSSSVWRLRGAWSRAPESAG